MWYTFTRLFHDKEFSILKGRLVVSIMQDNVRDGLASVGTDHDWTGDRDAEMLADYQAAPDGNKSDWGSQRGADLLPDLLAEHDPGRGRGL